MKWIVQNNLYREEEDFKIVKETFDKFLIPYFETTIKNGELYPKPSYDLTDDIMMMKYYL